MNMLNPEQIKVIIAVITPALVGLAGYWFSGETAASVGTAVASMLSAALMVLANTQSRAVAVVGQIAKDYPKLVQAVILAPTAGGAALAKVTPSTVVVAGTPEAKSFANSVPLI